MDTSSFIAIDQVRSDDPIVRTFIRNTIPETVIPDNISHKHITPAFIITPKPTAEIMFHNIISPDQRT